MRTGRGPQPMATAPTVVLAENDLAVAEPLVRAMREEGFTVEATPWGEHALARTAAGGVDLLVLDLGLADIDGLAACRRLRAQGSRVPVLVLISDTDVSQVEEQAPGSVDCVAKPYRLADLLTRIRAAVRGGGTEPVAPSRPAVSKRAGGPGAGPRPGAGGRSRPGAPAGPQVESGTDGADPDDPRLSCNGVTVDVRARRVWQGETELQLTAKEFDLLHALVVRAGRVVTREELMRQVWQTSWWSTTKTLDMHISWLRRKLGDSANRPRYITTVRGVGFRFESDPPAVQPSEHPVAEG